MLLVWCLRMNQLFMHFDAISFLIHFNKNDTQLFMHLDKIVKTIRDKITRHLTHSYGACSVSNSNPVLQLACLLGWKRCITPPLVPYHAENVPWYRKLYRCLKVRDRDHKWQWKYNPKTDIAIFVFCTEIFLRFIHYIYVHTKLSKRCNIAFFFNKHQKIYTWNLIYMCAGTYRSQVW